LILAAPATSWVEAVAKARYLLIWIARSPAAEDPRRATLIADVFADFKRLLADPKNPPVAGDAGLAPTSLIQRRIAMAKGQQRGNREAKKPKKEKPKVADVVPAQPPEIDGGERRSRQDKIARRNAAWLMRTESRDLTAVLGIPTARPLALRLAREGPVPDPSDNALSGNGGMICGRAQQSGRFRRSLASIIAR
jgi:hypothetical protein